MSTQEPLSDKLEGIFRQSSERAGLVAGTVGLVLATAWGHATLEELQRPNFHDEENKLCDHQENLLETSIVLPRNLNLSVEPFEVAQLNQGRVQQWKEHFHELHPVVRERYFQQIREWGPKLESTLHREGLPAEFVYLALIESGLNPQAYSHRHAAGLWQLRAGTARAYGLTVSETVDERFDPQKSTRAAARYLKDLRKRFGSWELAAAAYNVGPTWMARTLEEHDANTFWELAQRNALPAETREYVPRFLAVIQVGREAGLRVGNWDFSDPEEYLALADQNLNSHSRSGQGNSGTALR